MLDYKLTKFDNGLKMITAPMTNTKAVTILFLIGTGARYEPKKLNGISHFLEHLFFKGTKQRPTTLAIAQTLDSVGASYNAFTGEENTGFYVRSPAEHFDLALEVLNDIFYHSKFDEKEIDREKGVISEEINMYQDSPQSYIEEVIKKLFYGRHPLGRPIVGEKTTINQFSRADFLKFKDQHYNPNNMIVAIAGGKSNNQWQKKVEEYFQKVPPQKPIDYQPIRVLQDEPKVLIHHKKTDQAHLFLGFRSLSRTDKRRPILKVLSNLLGETMSSRLFTQVREKRGLAYYISSEMVDFQDTGIFGAAAGVDISRTEAAVKVILDEFQKIKTHLVKTVELRKAQENLKGKMYLGLEESMAVAGYLAEQALFWPKIEDPDDLISKYQQVTPKDIQDFAQEFFIPQNLNLALIGPFKNQEKFLTALRRYQ
ncbi:MAG: pitrilysin family protein [Patescibacteria group bacterium]